ncbi:ArnT family glycosyltransferase [Flexibacterium corallicola]|uniref:ArnT family glycosyltransferase n=1 Tax=Flexibacterium corallicola TaxID=3037259 RepID=UPI00286EDA45|nr:glycosyltransferase family 39 protein [Pseudovibrio sp. M1P-2-3]
MVSLDDSRNKSADHWLNFIPLILCVYFALQVIIRYFASDSLGLDEAEQIVAAQGLEWGYGPQPPLYSWLVSLFFAIFGEGVFTLALLKNLLLFAGYMGIWCSGRIIGGLAVGAIAAVSLLFLPQIAWVSQKTLSHSTLLFATSSWTIALFLFALKKPAYWKSCLLGVLIAAGVLSKFNYAFLFVALVLSAVCYQDGRRFLFSKQFILSIVIAGALLAPPVIWMFENVDLLFSRTKKFEVAAGGKARLDGIIYLVSSSLWFVAIAAVAYVGAFGFIRKKGEQITPDIDRVLRGFISLTLLLGVVLVTVLVLASGTTVVKGRWLQPVLFFTPLVALSWLYNRLSENRAKVLCALAFSLALLVSITLPINLNYGSFKKPPVRAIPYEGIAVIAEQRGVKSLFTINLALAGNLSYLLGDIHVATPEYAALDISYEAPVMVLWRHGASGRMPRVLQELYKRKLGKDPTNIQGKRISLPHKGWWNEDFQFWMVIEN